MPIKHQCHMEHGQKYQRMCPFRGKCLSKVSWPQICIVVPIGTANTSATLVLQVQRVFWVLNLQRLEVSLTIQDAQFPIKIVGLKLRNSLLHFWTISQSVTNSDISRNSDSAYNAHCQVYHSKPNQKRALCVSPKKSGGQPWYPFP